jgi:putative transposase
VGEVRADFDAELREFNGEHDHVHLPVHYPPKAALSKLVNSLKGVTTRRLRQEYAPQLRQHPWGGRFWSGSSFASSCSRAPLTVVKQHNENQQHPV